VLRRWPHDYWKTISWQMFRAHLEFERENRRDQERADERERQAAPLDTSTAQFGKPPPIQVLKTLPGWAGDN
jgi:hypothetical protein